VNTLDSVVKGLARDCAYTFKGLYKESDVKEMRIWIYSITPIGFTIFILAFPSLSSTLFGKIFTVITLIFSILLLFGKKSNENIEAYRKLANDYKILYDEFFMFYGEECKDNSQLEAIKNKKDELNIKSSKYPIGFIARNWSRRAIKEEMDIGWTE